MSEKTFCPDGCGKKFISKELAIKHADTDHPGWNDSAFPKQKGWATPYGFVDFSEPVSYEEACASAKSLQDHVWGNKYAKEKTSNQS